jgi:hypothetical protein
LPPESTRPFFARRASDGCQGLQPLEYVLIRFFPPGGRAKFIEKPHSGYRADLSHSDMLQQIKGRSSKWINETLASHEHFAWQEGYGGFTVSKSAVPDVEAYIARQKEHHQRFDYQTEFLELLRRHGIEFD